MAANDITVVNWAGKAFVNEPDLTEARFYSLFDSRYLSYKQAQMILHDPRPNYVVTADYLQDKQRDWLTDEIAYCKPLVLGGIHFKAEINCKTSDGKTVAFRNLPVCHRMFIANRITSGVEAGHVCW